ncbi:MAG: membrane protein insertase YidC [Rhodocyclaceae bacterium]
MDTQRIVLLLIFSFSLIMLWEAWQKQGQSQPAATAPAPGKPAARVPAPPGPEDVAGAVPVPAAPSKPAVEAKAAPASPAAVLATVKTDLYVAGISSQGGDIVSMDLNRYRATEDKARSFRLFDSGDRHVYQAQTGLIGSGLPNHRTLFRLAPGTYELKPGDQTLQLRLEAPESNGVRVSKLLTFKRGSYVIDVEYEISNGATQPLAAHAYFQLIRDGVAPASESSTISTFTGAAVYTESEKFQKIAFDDLAKGSAKFATKADNGWIGIVQHYFVSAWLPPARAQREFYARPVASGLYSAGVILPVGTIAPGSKGSVGATLYAGPQEQDKLAALAPGLDLVVDYGWLTVIAAPIFWVLQWLHRLVQNWGWSIILLTVLIKLMFFPLSAASYKSMARMRVVTPKMMKIKEMYGNDRARMNQEMMALYKKEKINPLGGCLPIVIQIPVFIALYWVLLASVEMLGAPWILWIHDLSAKDPYYVLPLIMGVTMFAQTKLNPTPPDPIQAKVMLAMPVVFTVMFLFFPAGLVLYWTVNNILSIAQQWQITRMIEAGGKASAAG